MAFYLKSNFAQNTGIYGDVFWCGYEGDNGLYIAKKLKTVDFGLEIEREAMTRLASLPTVYKLKRLENLHGHKYLVSHYVQGMLLKDYYSDNMENIFLHILCTMEILARVGVCHNDLHAGNIIVTPSHLTHVKYCFGVEQLKVKVNGELPVLIDFGLANIENYRYRPMISGFASGNMASLLLDFRFDKLKVFYVFKELLTEGPLQEIVAKIGKPMLRKFSAWLNRNRDLMWNPINTILEYKFPNVFELVDYHTSGVLLSFPNTAMPDYDSVMKHLTKLELFLNDSMVSLESIAGVLKEGPTHPHYYIYCLLGQLMRTGTANLVRKFKESQDYKALGNLPMERELIDYIIKHEPKHVFRPIEAMGRFTVSSTSKL